MQNQPQAILGGADHSGISGSELRRVIVAPLLAQRALKRDWDRTGVFDENGRELSQQEAFDEAVEELGLVFDERGILISDVPTGFFVGEAN